MLEIPAINVVELWQVLVAGCNQADRTNGRKPGSKQHYVPDAKLCSEAPNEPIFEFRIRPLRTPRPRIAGTDQSDTVFQELIGVGAVGRTGGNLPYSMLDGCQPSVPYRQQHGVEETLLLASRDG